MERFRSGEVSQLPLQLIDIELTFPVAVIESQYKYCPHPLLFLYV